MNKYHEHIVFVSSIAVRVNQYIILKIQITSRNILSLLKLPTLSFQFDLQIINKTIISKYPAFYKQIYIIHINIIVCMCRDRIGGYLHQICVKYLYLMHRTDRRVNLCMYIWVFKIILCRLSATDDELKCKAIALKRCSLVFFCLAIIIYFSLMFYSLLNFEKVFEPY